MSLENLENTITSTKESPETKTDATNPKISKDEEIGFHKGALNTLIAERNELVKMINNVETIMQAHILKLKNLGINLK